MRPARFVNASPLLGAEASHYYSSFCGRMFSPTIKYSGSSPTRCKYPNEL
ncbi:hypothetical protein IG193_01565 [Infirmifilum lucidum]|uniref:Uncharacterized protein n=1 Tax=Infirmifilum lucidum TaxID=2776706 RepID=A0A7L9FHH9_9CREN|nr:hypothetical protein [Infirmifilum lucidum]QOJ79177.1 hypothetical protein IG193_01565 [Infirmifilum lucidum]